MSSSVDDTQSGAKNGDPTRKKLKTGEIEFCKKTASHFSLSSDGEFLRYESDSDDEKVNTIRLRRTPKRMLSYEYEQAVAILSTFPMNCFFG